ncbi:hypothetical protein SAMN05661107_0889 [Maritimibacter sp. HL-12]|nr:hypothetical protein SAMN05661107_0889 [Maritimibacter sp. HL-12]
MAQTLVYRDDTLVCGDRKRFDAQEPLQGFSLDRHDRSFYTVPDGFHTAVTLATGGPTLSGSRPRAAIPVAGRAQVRHGRKRAR